MWVNFFPWFETPTVRWDPICDSTRRKNHLGIECWPSNPIWLLPAGSVWCWLGLHHYSEVSADVLWLICSSCLGHYFGVLFICGSDGANRKSFPFCWLRALLVISKTSMPLTWERLERRLKSPLYTTPVENNLALLRRAGHLHSCALPPLLGERPGEMPCVPQGQALECKLFMIAKTDKSPWGPQQSGAVSCGSVHAEGTV